LKDDIDLFVEIRGALKFPQTETFLRSFEAGLLPGRFCERKTGGELPALLLQVSQSVSQSRGQGSDDTPGKLAGAEKIRILARAEMFGSIDFLPEITSSLGRPPDGSYSRSLCHDLILYLDIIDNNDRFQRSKKPQNEGSRTEKSGLVKFTKMSKNS